MDLQFLAEFGVEHIASWDVKRWTWAVDEIANEGRHQSARFHEYYHGLSPFIPSSCGNATAFSLDNLNDPQRWLLLVVIDEFLDQWIISHASFEEWVAVWDKSMQLYITGYKFIQARPGVLDRPRLEHAWNCLRAAVS